MPYAAPVSTAVDFQAIGSAYELPLGYEVNFFLEDADGGRMSMRGTSSVMFESPHETINTDFAVTAGASSIIYASQFSPTSFTVAGETVADVRIITQQSASVTIFGKTTPKLIGLQLSHVAFTIAGEADLRLLPAGISRFDIPASTVFTPSGEGRTATSFAIEGTTPMGQVGGLVREGGFASLGTGLAGFVTDFAGYEEPPAEAITVRSVTKVAYVFE